jgi:hypothetical protein
MSSGEQISGVSGPFDGGVDGSTGLEGAALDAGASS